MTALISRFAQESDFKLLIGFKLLGLSRLIKDPVGPNESNILNTYREI